MHSSKWSKVPITFPFDKDNSDDCGEPSLQHIQAWARASYLAFVKKNKKKYWTLFSCKVSYLNVMKRLNILIQLWTVDTFQQLKHKWACGKTYKRLVFMQKQWCCVYAEIERIPLL